MARGRKKHGYLLFDLPSDYEIEGGLSTECDIINAVVTNIGLGNRSKTIKVATPATFKSVPLYQYAVQYVHLGCHGGDAGIGMVGGTLSWSETADLIKRHLKPLKEGEKRVLCLSYCHSHAGHLNMKDELTGYFTGVYYFEETSVGFATAITVWAMFYARKDLKIPHLKIVNDVNTFFGSRVLVFRAM